MDQNTTTFYCGKRFSVIPAAIVGVALGVTKTEGYGNEVL